MFEFNSSILAVMRLVIFLVPLAAQGQLKFTAEYSAWTGPVTEIKVGSESQVLKVGLSYQMDKHVLWNPQTCPVDDGCFYTSKSTTYQLLKTAIENQSIIQLFADSIQIGELEAFPTTFVTLPLRPAGGFNGLLGYDVAGMIGAGISSELFENSIMHLSEARDSFGEDRQRVNFEQVGEPIVGTWFSPQVDEKSFGFKAEINAFWGFDFIFDLATDQLVIPGSLLPTFLKSVIPSINEQDYQVEEYGRLVIKCYLKDRLNINLRIKGVQDGSWMLVSIPASMFRTTPINQAGPNSWCWTGIGLSNRAKNIEIGRLLLQRTSGVVLNYETGMMGFVPGAAPETGFQPPVASLPNKRVYGYPTITTSGIDFRVITDHRSNEPYNSVKGWILMNEKPRTRPEFTFISPSASSECWEFRALAGGDMLSLDPEIETMIDPKEQNVFDDMQMEISQDGSIMYRFINNANMKRQVVPLAVQTNHMSIIICKQVTLNEYLTFDIPDEEDEDPNAPHETCEFCLENSQLRQGLRNCGHKFHRWCLGRKLTANGDLCPTCKEPIHAIAEPMQKETYPN